MIFSTLDSIWNMCVIAFIIIFLSFPQIRHWLLALLAGTAYWLLLDGIKYCCVFWLQCSTFEGYLIGITLTLVSLAIWLALTEEKRKTKQRAYKLAQQIEHTPLHHTEQWQHISRHY